MGRKIKLTFRFHEIATQARNDKVFGLRPKRSLIRSALINGMCDFEDGTRAAAHEIDERSYAEHLFKVCLFTECACSE